MSTIFEEIIGLENVETAYRLCMQGKSKYRLDAMIFDRDKTHNINALLKDLTLGTYAISEYTEFYVYEPKERKIYAPRFRDKLVQMMINNTLKIRINKSFIYDSYACIDNKGTHKCAERIQSFLKKSGHEYLNEAFIVKVDVKKFFYTIDRAILKGMLPKFIPCDKTLELLYLIIDSSPGDLGLPLGNVTSHMLANIYAHYIDVMCKRKLSVKYYVRYMDDIALIVKGKDRAKEVLAIICELAQDNLSLSLNEKKTKIFPLEQGVNMVGYKIYKTHRLLRNDSKKKIKRKLKKMPRLIRDGKMTKEKAEQMINSWKGHAQNCNSANFILKLFKKHEFLKTDKNGSIKLKEE